MTIYKNYDELCRKTLQMPPETDLWAFCSLYRRFGIELEMSFDEKLKGESQIAIIIRIGSDASPKIEGDMDYYVCFNKDGKHIRHNMPPYPQNM